MKVTAGGLPELAVRRPLLIAVMNLLIVIAGLAALLGIDVRELPDVERPIVQVRASYPGAAPETMDAEVTRVLEGAAARVSGVREINSASEENNSRLNIEFEAGTDLDIAASDVREAISRVVRDLPDRVENLFVAKADEDANPIMTMAVIGDSYREDELTRIIETDILPEIQSIDGVAAVQEFGTRQQQMRVAIDPLRLNRFGLTVQDVADALRQAPFDVPAGSYRSGDQELLVRAEAVASTPERVKDVVISAGTQTNNGQQASDGRAVRVGDVADVMLAPADAENLLRYNGKPVIGLGIVRRAQANTIQISEAVRAKLVVLNERFDDTELVVTSDDAVFVSSSVTEVFITLLITTCVVIGTIWLFLGSWRATLIPAAGIPIALIGTVAGIWLMGFSINLLTLLALVLAAGLIVDDTVVVLENVQRRQSEGMPPLAAAAIGTHQVFFAVVATTAVLVAVFVPISFLPSTTGRLFREFGFVMALAVILSSFVALTLAPAMAARLELATNSKQSDKPKGRAIRAYSSVLNSCLNHPWLTLLVSLCLAAAAVFGFTQLDRELVPSEDRGRIEVFATGPDGVGLQFMERQSDQIEDVLLPLTESGEISSLFTVVGRYDPNRIGITATLAPWADRERNQQDIINELKGPLSDIPGSRVSVFGRSSLAQRGGGGNRGGLEVALTGGNYDEIYAVARRIAEAIDTESTILSNSDISYQPTQPQLALQVDRQRADDLDVSLDEISSTLQAMVGGDELIDLNVRDQSIAILLEAEVSAISTPADLRNLFVRSRDGTLVPLSSLTNIVEQGIAAELDRFEQRRAMQVEADIKPGVPLADAVAEIRRLADGKLENGVNMVMQGEAATLQETSSELLLTYAFALVIVLLVLIAQFESLTSPVVVMLTVPFGLAAAVFALMQSGVSLNIYSQIGLILLIGLIAKNGILLVEFADQLRGEGRSIREAVFEAATIRVRPIVMTLVSTMLGALPLILSGGAGAEARNAIGWVVFGGLGIAVAFTLFLAPVIYLGLARFGKPRSDRSERLTQQLKEHANGSEAGTADRLATQ